jgi:hypothetical protein
MRLRPNARDFDLVDTRSHAMPQIEPKRTVEERR